MFPLVAHTIQVVKDVGVTFHLEPNHTPTAGKPSLAWFALTRRGNRTIPLSQCSCSLEIYTAKNPKTPLFSAPLRGVNQEQYQAIPGATLVFPWPGKYRLELQGTPRTKGDFMPFKVSYEVIVKK